MIRAAGVVLWREPKPFELEIALVHRPQFDDWTFPKGKIEDGESAIQAAYRETFEETGLVLGRRDLGQPERPPEGAWSRFATMGAYPDLEGMHFIARAITPPGRARRFDTSFLAMDAVMIIDQLANIVGPEAELVEVVRLPLSKALQLDMPMITWVILNELAHRLKAGMGHDLPVPFYREIRGKWVREEL